MPVLASFNYCLPSIQDLVVAVVLALLALVVVARCRQVLVGITVTSMAWTTITWIVVGRGNGDLTEILQVFFAIVSAIAGAVIGGVSVRIAKRRAGGVPEDHHAEK